MATDIDQRLARFKEGDITVMICQGILERLPYGEPLNLAFSLEALLRHVAPEAGPDVLARAREYSSE